MINTRVDWPEADRVQAIGAASTRLLSKMAKDPGAACVWSLPDVVWPSLDPKSITEGWLKNVTLALVPLSRIGQMEGKSGSLVLVGRFWSEAERRPSHPLIVKTRRKSGLGALLSDEWKRARAAKPYTYDRKDSFAIPIAFDDEDPCYEVLWSLCMPSIRESEAPTIDPSIFPTVSDLRTLLAFSPQRTGDLDAEKHSHVATILEGTYALLRNLHRASVTGGGSALPRDTRAFGIEYDWYLRRYGLGPEGLWGPEWIAVWAPPSERLIHDAINPMWLIERLRAETATMHIGTVHGDLHPGNVILRDGDAPALIDFGWSASEAHIAKDFVLMECNLRFLTLRSQVAEAELAAFAGWSAWEAPFPVLASDHLSRRTDLIQRVRKAAQQVFAKDTDWNREYLAPLFIVAFGLLRFAPQIGNQNAAIRFIESLAQHLANSLALS